MSRIQGFIIEKKVKNYLEREGLICLETNFSCKLGEIDLVMHDKSYIVFVEIRFRTSKQFGSALESVSVSKQRKIIKTAHYYLQQRGLTHKASCRFDVVAVQGMFHKIQWVQNAFI